MKPFCLTCVACCCKQIKEYPQYNFFGLIIGLVAFFGLEGSSRMRWSLVAAFLVVASTPSHTALHKAWLRTAAPPVRATRLLLQVRPWTNLNRVRTPTHPQTTTTTW